MSVSEFRFAVYSGSVWNDFVELDNELFLADKGEGLCLSILKYFILVLDFSVFVTITRSFTISYYCFFIQGTISFYLSQSFFQQDF